MLHMQKKSLDLKITGDQVVEKQVDKSNLKQIGYLIKYEYKI